MVIDAHSHVCPAELIDAIAEARPGPEVEDLRSRPYLYDWDARVRYMDAHGFDLQVLVLARPPMWLGLERTEVHELARLANDSIARAVATHPDRFVGVGVLPIVDDVMLGELERIRELGLRGVQIYSNIEGEPIDAKPMWGLFEAAAAADFPIWIHPQHGPTHEWMSKDLVNRLFYWPFETSAAMARLVYGGVLDRFPELKILTHHLGGMVSFYGARIESFTDRVAQFAHTGLTTATAPRTGRDVVERFAGFYADTAVSGSPIALRCGLDFFGADRVVLGTDFPFEGEQVPVEILRSVRELDVPDDVRAKILGGNAARLLKLES